MDCSMVWSSPQKNIDSPNRVAAGQIYILMDDYCEFGESPGRRKRETRQTFRPASRSQRTVAGGGANTIFATILAALSRKKKSRPFFERATKALMMFFLNPSRALQFGQIGRKTFCFPLSCCCCCRQTFLSPDDSGRKVICPYFLLCAKMAVVAAVEGSGN